MTEHIGNGQGREFERVTPYRQEFAGEVIRPEPDFNKSGLWLAHEREQWMRWAGVLDDEEEDDGYYQD